MRETHVAALSDEEQFQNLLVENWPTAAVLGVLLVLLWLVTPSIVRPLVRRTLKGSSRKLDDGGVTAIELGKRSATIESLVVTMVRVVIAVVLAVIVVGMLQLWWLLAGMGLLAAAVTLAGQPVVLDFLMGLTIIGEGTFFKGDNIAVGDPKFKIFGSVESVGLRHTVIRAPDGTVHAISNRLMVQVSNRTRAFSGADVTVRGIREADFARVLQIMGRVGREVHEDSAVSSSVLEPLVVAYVDDPDELGWSAVMRGRVVAGERWAVGTEVRKRIALALREEGIQLNRRGVIVQVGAPGPGAQPGETSRA